jgi:hypothetical protein
MEIFGFDIILMVLSFAFVMFWGTIFIGFVFLWDKNPYVPRKYYDVEVFNKENVPLFKCKAWQVTTNHVKYLRIMLKGFPKFSAVEKDISILETINKKGIIEIIEDVPDLKTESNYSPKNIPITQKESFITEILENVEEASRPAFEMKIRDAIARNSRVVDLNTSKATKEYIAQARREAERVRGDDFMYKYGPTIILIMAGLFAFLILDGAQKSWQATSMQQAGIMENGYKQIVSQCGGVYEPIIKPKNESEAKPGPIPFVNG